MMEERGAKKRKCQEGSWVSSSKQAKVAPVAPMLMGFRFSPTETELVECLGSMIRSEGVLVPADAEGFIHPVNIYEHHPRALTAMFPPAHDVRGEWYFFTGREARYPKGRRPDRRAGDAGFWKATGGLKNVKDYWGRLIGRKMTLVFYESSESAGYNITKKRQTSAAEKTRWIMHEYEHVSTSSSTKKNNADGQFQSWVLCRIHHGGKEPATASAPLLLEEDSDDLAVDVPHVEEEENACIWDALMNSYETVLPSSPLPSSHWSFSHDHDQVQPAAPSQQHSDDYSALTELDWDLEEGLVADMLSDLLDHD